MVYFLKEKDYYLSLFFRTRFNVFFSPLQVSLNPVQIYKAGADEEKAETARLV